MKNNKMSPYLSDKIKAMSFFSILLVVYIHTYYTEGENYAGVMMVMNVLGNGIARLAVPLFYLISGYLLFLHLDSFTSCLAKMKKRVKTLLVPYLLANTLAFCFFSFFDLVSRCVPRLGGVMNFHVLKWCDEGLGMVLYNIYWSPIAYQLWFVRDMMIFICFLPIVSPVLRILAKKKIMAVLSIVLLLMLQDVLGMLVLYMAIGGMLAYSDVYKVTNIIKSKVLTGIFGLLWIVLIAMNTKDILPKNMVFLMPVMGILCVWSLYDLIFKGKCICEKNIGQKITGFTFFIYLIHIPMLLIFKKVPLLLDRGEIMILFCYLFVPWVFVAFAIVFGSLCKKLLGKFYYVYTGGR